MGASILGNGTVYLRNDHCVRDDLGDCPLMSTTYQTPLKLFREGLDTVQIAEHLGCSEATAANLIHRAKEAEREGKGHKPANFWRNGYTKGLVPYAGMDS